MDHILKDVSINSANLPQQCECEQLTEDDIPGAKFSNDPEKHKKTELTFWLKCRGLTVKKSETRAQLCNRVRKCLENGSHEIVDPDPNKCHLILKQLNCKKCSNQPEIQSQASNIDIRIPYNLKNRLPLDGWTKATNNLPAKFSHISLNEHAKTSGKNQTYVEKPLDRGYKFFWDGYVHDVSCCTKEQSVFVKGKCFRSMKKSEPPHICSVQLNCLSGKVEAATCSCVAGISGHCNHIFGLLYSIDHVTKMKLDKFPNYKTCTEKPAEWVKSRTDGVNSEPVMGCQIYKPRYNSTSNGINCTLYDARGPSVKYVSEQNNAFEKIREKHSNLGIFKVLNKSGSVNETKTRLKFSVPLGSPLSYQLSLTEANFKVVQNIDYAKFENISIEEPTTPPVFPWNKNEAPNVDEDILNLFKLQLNSDETVDLEKKTRGQSTNSTWKSSRLNRLTASKFGLVLQRKTSRNDKFVQNTILQSSDLSHVPAVKYGLDNEAVAARHYVNYMNNSNNGVQTYECGLVVNADYPWTAASPDRIVYDSKCGFGLIEIKCAYSKKDITPYDACSDPSFFCFQDAQGNPTLKQSHQYYAQVQGQLGITGSLWCDFVVFTNKGLVIERIPFDKKFWGNMMPKLKDFYVRHIVPVIRAKN